MVSRRAQASGGLRRARTADAAPSRVLPTGPSIVPQRLANHTFEVVGGRQPALIFQTREWTLAKWEAVSRRGGDADTIWFRDGEGAWVPLTVEEDRVAP